jgi:TldD protein
MTHDEKLSKMRSILDKTLALSDELVDARIIYEEVQISKIFISKNKDLTQDYLWTNAAIIPIGVREGRMKYAISVASGLKGAEILDELEGLYTPAVTNITRLLGSKPMKAGEYDVILDPDMAGLVAHEAFGHGVEMDMFVKNRAKAAEYMNKEVASTNVNMYDGAASAVEISSYLFDDEGILGTDTKIIDKGILVSGISDVLSALKLGTRPTGNGKRQSYEHKAYTRMTNTFFAGGNDKVEDMIASIDYGFLLESYSSGMEDPKNWGIQCVVSRGREIKDGKLTGNVFSPIFLTGYVPDLLKSMSMVSEDVVITGNGMCGKGYKEYVKTSTGGPFIKARGRLN